MKTELKYLDYFSNPLGEYRSRRSLEYEAILKIAVSFKLKNRLTEKVANKLLIIPIVRRIAYMRIF